METILVGRVQFAPKPHRDPEEREQTEKDELMALYRNAKGQLDAVEKLLRRKGLTFR